MKNIEKPKQEHKNQPQSQQPTFWYITYFSRIKFKPLPRLTSSQAPPELWLPPPPFASSLLPGPLLPCVLPGAKSLSS